MRPHTKPDNYQTESVNNSSAYAGSSPALATNYLINLG